MDSRRETAGSEFERTILILRTLGELIERLRRIATLLQTGRRRAADKELQLLLTRLDQLITALAEGSPPIPPYGRILIPELRLVRGDVTTLDLLSRTQLSNS